MFGGFIKLCWSSSKPSSNASMEMNEDEWGTNILGIMVALVRGIVWSVSSGKVCQFSFAGLFLRSLFSSMYVPLFACKR